MPEHQFEAATSRQRAGSRTVATTALSVVVFVAVAVVIFGIDAIAAIPAALQRASDGYVAETQRGGIG